MAFVSLQQEHIRMVTGRYDHNCRKLIPSQSPRLPPITEIIVNMSNPINWFSWTFTLKINKKDKLIWTSNLYKFICLTYVSSKFKTSVALSFKLEITWLKSLDTPFKGRYLLSRKEPEARLYKCGGTRLRAIIPCDAQSKEIQLSMHIRWIIKINRIIHWCIF